MVGVAIAVAAGRPALADRAVGLDLVPPDAAFAVVVGHLKRASDDLADCIERMERSQVLIGGRPLDQLKSMAGLVVAVDDTGAGAMIVPAGTDPRLGGVLVVPVNDSASFLDANFTAGPDGELRTMDGVAVFARVIGEGHVAVARDVKLLNAYRPPAPGAFAASLHAKLAPLVDRGDALLFASPSGIDALRAGAGELGPDVEGFEQMLVAIDIDPLGVGVRGMAVFDPESAAGRATAGGEESTKTLSRVADRPYYGAVSVDLAGLGGAEGLRAVAPAVEIPGWLASARAFHLGVFPSRLGVSIGGILNDAALVVETDDPAALRSAMKAEVLAAAGERDGEVHTPTWEDDKALRGGGTADAFEVSSKVGELDDSTNASAITMRRTFRRMVFGRRGFHGFAKTTPGSLVVTFSQRPDVLASGLAASRGDAPLAGNPTVAAMRGWMLEDPDIEGFVGVGELGALLRQLVTMVPFEVGEIPMIDEGTEPVGFSVEVDDHAIEGALVIPASVLAVLYDQAKGFLADRLLGDPAGPGGADAP
jgi:hypothetical protein